MHRLRLFLGQDAEQTQPARGGTIRRARRARPQSAGTSASHQRSAATPDQSGMDTEVGVRAQHAQRPAETEDPKVQQQKMAQVTVDNGKHKERRISQQQQRRQRRGRRRQATSAAQRHGHLALSSLQRRQRANYRKLLRLRREQTDPVKSRNRASSEDAQIPRGNHGRGKRGGLRAWKSSVEGSRLAKSANVNATRSKKVAKARTVRRKLNTTQQDVHAREDNQSAPRTPVAWNDAAAELHEASQAVTHQDPEGAAPDRDAPATEEGAAESEFGVLDEVVESVRERIEFLKYNEHLIEKQLNMDRKKVRGGSCLLAVAVACTTSAPKTYVVAVIERTRCGTNQRRLRQPEKQFTSTT